MKYVTVADGAHTNLFVLANLSLERTPYDVNTSIVEKWVSHDRNT